MPGGEPTMVVPVPPERPVYAVTHLLRALSNELTAAEPETVVAMPLIEALDAPTDARIVADALFHKAWATDIVLPAPPVAVVSDTAADAEFQSSG